MQRKKPRKLKKRKNKIRVVDAAHSPLFHTAVPVRNRGLCVYSGSRSRNFKSLRSRSGTSAVIFQNRHLHIETTKIQEGVLELRLRIYKNEF